MHEAQHEHSTADRKLYYRARGLSTYYFVNAIFNIVRTPMTYMRGIEDILGDARTEWFSHPFKNYTNLHEFARCAISRILTEDLHDEEANLSFLKEFVTRYNIPLDLADYEEDRDGLADAFAESEEFDNALEELTDEVFHVLFNDVGFLQKFNSLLASYFRDAGFEPSSNSHVMKNGRLRRVRIPVWARRAIYFRDRGECRACKRTLAMTINQTEFERYDHIVALAFFGANDVTNLQLLCVACNSEKAARSEPVSELYLKALQQ
jgi:hypothetical protein